ncbi:hypothetical protein GCM10010211_37320 [Streptomyces albospinus]|uniref:Uncharacterized protein n=1 Tax=Streptomyces albospinus TaxID=285515 RepID=A0ABQ2V6Z2_9ACTN|nr:hypothetical protein GCM10010211_37320 [Streptomyces albospinus]
MGEEHPPRTAATDDAGRLSPLFVEWMQGLDPGWVTATPGLGRSPNWPPWAMVLCRNRPPEPCRSSPRPDRPAATTRCSDLRLLHQISGIAKPCFLRNLDTQTFTPRGIDV